MMREAVAPSLFSKDIWPGRWAPKATDASRLDNLDTRV